MACKRPAVSPASLLLMAFKSTDTEMACSKESSLWDCAHSGCNSAPRLNFGKETSDNVSGDQ